MNLDEIVDIAGHAGMSFTNHTYGGREFHFRAGAPRTVLVVLDRSDMPQRLSEVLCAVFSLADHWIVLARYGELRATEFPAADSGPLVSSLIDSIPEVMTSDDLYVLAADGTALVTFGHHLLDDGLIIELNDIDRTGQLLLRLNDLGTQFEVLSV